MSRSPASGSDDAHHQQLNQLVAGDRVHRNLPAGALVEHAIRRGEGRLAANGSLASETGKRTGRSPKDKFTVQDALTAGQELDVHGVGVAGGDGHHQRLVQAVQLLAGPAFGGAEVAIHGKRNSSRLPRLE